jgi:hypothetical protein
VRIARFNYSVRRAGFFRWISRGNPRRYGVRESLEQRSLAAILKAMGLRLAVERVRAA